MLLLIFWFVCFVVDIALVCSNFYQLVVLSDLEADFMNPYESSSIINYWVFPEMVMHGVLCALFLLGGQWIMFLISAPLTGYIVMLYMKKRHLIDVTEVFRNLNFEKKYRYVKIAFYLFTLFLIIFRLVLSAFYAIAHDDSDGMEFF